MTWGKFNAKQQALEEKVDAIDKGGGAYARESITRLNERVAYHESRLVSGEAKHDKVIAVLDEIKVSLARIVAKIENK